MVGTPAFYTNTNVTIKAPLQQLKIYASIQKVFATIVKNTKNIVFTLKRAVSAIVGGRFCAAENKT